MLPTHSMTCWTYARCDFTTARLPGEQSLGSEGSASGESPLVRAVPGVTRGRRPGFPETTALSHRSRRQAGPHRFPACLPREPPSRKAGHCPRRGRRPPGGPRRDTLGCADWCSFTHIVSPGEGNRVKGCTRRSLMPRLRRRPALAFIRREIGAIGMVEDDGAHAGLRFHHHAFGQLHADIAGLEKLPHALLIVQVGTRRVAEVVALAVILGSKAIVHGHGGRVGEAPILADAAVQPLRRGLSGFDGQRLDGVGLEELARLFPLLALFADTSARGDYHERQMIALAVVTFQDVIAQAEPVFAALAAKAEGGNRRLARRREQVDGVAVALGFEELPHRSHFHAARGFPCRSHLSPTQ